MRTWEIIFSSQICFSSSPCCFFLQPGESGFSPDGLVGILATHSSPIPLPVFLSLPHFSSPGRDSERLSVGQGPASALIHSAGGATLYNLHRTLL